MYDIVFYEAFKEEATALKKYIPRDLNIRLYRGTIQECHHRHIKSSLISIRTQSKIPKAWAPLLKGILTRSTGYDHIIEYVRLTQTKAQLGYLPHYCSRAVAEQAVLMMMALWRKLALQQKSFLCFARDNITGEECRGKKLLVVGVGRIGGEIVDIAQGLGMKVKGVDIAPRKKGVRYTRLAAGLAWADGVVCALPLTQKTRGMFIYKRLQKLRRGTIFINISRGEISPIKDMKKLLKEKRLGGLALDVYEHEADLAVWLRRHKTIKTFYRKDLQELASMPNVILTPHNAFNTYQALGQKARDSMDAVKSFFKNNKFPNEVVI